MEMTMTLRDLQTEVKRRYYEKRDIVFLAGCLSAESGEAFGAVKNMLRAESGCYVDKVVQFDADDERAELAGELADVLFYTAAIANHFDWDLEALFNTKMLQNDIKYSRKPVDPRCEACGLPQSDHVGPDGPHPDSCAERLAKMKGARELEDEAAEGRAP